MLRTGILITAAAVALSAVFVVSGVFGRNVPTFASTPEANVTNSYTGVVNALTNGKDVEVTTRLQECTTPDGKPGPSVTGGLHINAYQIPQGQFIAFSDTHQTLDPQNQSITEFIRYTVTPNGAMTLATTTLSATQQVMSTVTLTCHLGKGAYFHWS